MRRLALFLLVSLLLAACTASPTVQAPPSTTVYYAGSPDTGVLRALELAAFERVTSADQAEVIVLNGVLPDPQGLHRVHVP